jgi:hypothetical protein
MAIPPKTKQNKAGHRIGYHRFSQDRTTAPKNEVRVAALISCIQHATPKTDAAARAAMIQRASSREMNRVVVEINQSQKTAWWVRCE